MKHTQIVLNAQVFSHHLLNTKADATNTTTLNSLFLPSEPNHRSISVNASHQAGLSNIRSRVVMDPVVSPQASHHHLVLSAFAVDFR